MAFEAGLNGWVKYCRYLKMDYHPALKGNYAICDNMDEHWGHYGK